MMNKPRLIDANELIKNLCETFCGQNPCSVPCETIKAIEDQPTAYSIDEIVKQLESNSWKSPKEPHRLMWLDRAIEIVKGGAE